MLHDLNSKRTKIVATLGPASWDDDVIRALIRAGMNVARINFSHGDHDRHGKTIAAVRRIAEEEGAVVAILCDIQGPKIRIGLIENEPMMLEVGETLRLTLDDVLGKDKVVALPHPEFMRDLKPDTRLLVDDGNIELLVKETNGTSILCEVVIGGPLKSRKGVSAPNAKLTLSAITDKDRADIEFALQQKTDFIAMSFVRKQDDVRELRWLIKHFGGDAAIIAKIEMQEALENIEAIIEVADGIMVARGDLGIETPAEQVPYHQKRIIQLCNQASKPVITATQMLESMTRNPRPTRAEASDVYNAIIDGTDAVMLSAESASGDYPEKAVSMMATIARIAEQHIWDNRQRSFDKRHFEVTAQTNTERISDAISEATFHISEVLSPKAIVTTTLSGYTARRVARERPSTPIICITPNKVTYHRMALVWGVVPVLVPEFNTIDEMISVISRATIEAKLLRRGETIIIIAGVPFGVGGQTNLLKIHRIGESGEI